MKHRWVSLMVALAGFVAWGQNPARDASGFLAVPAEPAETVSVPADGADLQAGPTEVVVATVTQEVVSALGSYELDDKHKLMPGDRISFEIKEDRTNAFTLPVTESGELDVPYLGRVSVQGRTCKQLAQDIKAMLEKDYYYTATVVIGLNERAKTVGKVYIYGPVRNPGPRDIPSNEIFTASKAIMAAGGFGDFANPRKVEIIRKTPFETNILVNLENVFKKGRTEEDVPLQPDDFIIVRERLVNFRL